MQNKNALNQKFIHCLQKIPDLFHTPNQQSWEQFISSVDIGEDAWRVLEDTLDELLKVWTASPFVMQYCLRHGNTFMNMLCKGDFERDYSTEKLHDLANAALVTDNEQALMQSVRQFRNQNMVRIAWRDIAGKTDFQNTISELSNLADCCIRAACEFSTIEQTKKFGTPQDADGSPQTLVVIAMGKLGAHELNFSSDIDLIFTYPNSGNTQSGPRNISNEEFFAHVGRQLIRILDTRTADGFVFRVDMRLRPFGTSGPLVVSFDGLENYYQIHGREWERYALIKARAVTGDAHSIDELNAFLRPFVYRRYLDYGVYDELRDMKQRIVTEVSKKGLDHNIKLGAGGIREIEFIGQAFQLIRGGRDNPLQQRQILKVLDHLAAKSIMPDYAVKDLKAAYEFLRTTEHRLQQVADKQTHELPEQSDERARLAFSMGFASWQDFSVKLQFHRNKVRDQFEQVFSAPQITQENTDQTHSPPAQIWLELVDDENARRFLDQLGFEGDAAFSHIQLLRNSSAVRALSKRGQMRMDVLMPMLIGAVSQVDNATQTLQRVLQLIQAIARRTSYLALLAENPIVLSQVSRLCAASPWFAHQLSKFPILLDELLDARTLYKPPGRASLKKDLQLRLQQIDSQDLEAQMECLRLFKQTNVLRVAAADLVDAIPLMVVSDHLTFIAEVILDQVFNLAWQTVHAKHGAPQAVPNRPDKSSFTVIAYGKLGGIELSYGSDLDLVFLYGVDPNGETNGAKPVAVPVFYSRVGQRMIHMLTALTSAGTLYEVDMRLRPSGASGLLVSHIDSFADYQHKSAWIWEHQALVRARPVAGDETVAAQFVDIRKAVLSAPRDAETLRTEVVAMREKLRAESAKNHKDKFDIKQGSGGIADIEFMVQYMALSAAQRFPNLIEYTDNIRILDAIKNNGLMPPQDVTILADIYRQLRDQVHKLALQEQPAVVDNNHYVKEREAILAIWHKTMLPNK